MIADGPQRHRGISAIIVNLQDMYTHVSHFLPFSPQRELKFLPNDRNHRRSGSDELPVTQNINWRVTSEAREEECS